MKTISIILLGTLLVGCRTAPHEPVPPSEPQAQLKALDRLEERCLVHLPNARPPDGVTNAELEEVIKAYFVFAKAEASGQTPTPLSPRQIRVLQQYQMDVIRAKGKKGVPLPMPLSAEMDAQLVKEGVFPSRNEK
ncbi:MAG: hypothetical protein PHR77_07105 [Kiritimatiellae bacterium]|nr:hypothetical protein [Kiritimatiellia bacterium]MDD5522961.1 hypothetical protein [Kiritimatiellia bacterium]